MSLGVDVVDVERFRGALRRSPRLALRLFTESERAYCLRCPDPPVRFAGTLAAKEAVIKAERLGNLVAWARRIEIERGPDGAPTARLSLEGMEVEIEVSIAHDGGVALAAATSS